MAQFQKNEVRTKVITAKAIGTLSRSKVFLNCMLDSQGEAIVFTLLLRLKQFIAYRI
jgi:hypothetical protein